MLIGAVIASEEAVEQPSREAMDELMALGKEVYDQRCALCHQPNGLGVPGVFPPLVEGAPFEAAAHITQPLEERGFYEDGKIMLGPVDKNVEIVVNGIPGTRMFAFGPELTNNEIAAVVTYHRNAWGNDTGDVVTPEEVEPFRDQ
jgi:cytochrome c oxidase subunit 2